jgi:hypothetical protein
MGKCVVCGRKLITGRKYCHIHRSLGKESAGIRERAQFRRMAVAFFALIILGLGIGQLAKSARGFIISLIVLICVVVTIRLKIRHKLNVEGLLDFYSKTVNPLVLLCFFPFIFGFAILGYNTFDFWFLVIFAVLYVGFGFFYMYRRRESPIK